MTSIKTLSQIDIAPLLDEYAKLEPNIQWTEFPTGRQAGLQHRLNEDPWTDAVGVWRAKKDTSTRWVDENYLNPFFKDTLFEELIREHNLKRTRLLWLKPQSCYTMHQDPTPRVHIPLITNSACLFLFEDCVPTYMAPGCVYLADTTKMHAAVNCSNEWRLHLVGAVC